MPVERFSIHAQKQFVSCLDSLDMLKYAAIFYSNIWKDCRSFVVLKLRKLSHEMMGKRIC